MTTGARAALVHLERVRALLRRPMTAGAAPARRVVVLFVATCAVEVGHRQGGPFLLVALDTCAALVEPVIEGERPPHGPFVHREGQVSLQGTDFARRLPRCVTRGTSVGDALRGVVAAPAIEDLPHQQSTVGRPHGVAVQAGKSRVPIMPEDGVDHGRERPRTIRSAALEACEQRPRE